MKEALSFDENMLSLEERVAKNIEKDLLKTKANLVSIRSAFEFRFARIKINGVPMFPCSL